MDVLYFVFSWGSPVGLASFFFLSGLGGGIFFWGLSLYMERAKSSAHEEK